LTGLGNIAGLCSSRSVTVCQEWNQYASVGTATHELGHKSVLASIIIIVIIIIITTIIITTLHQACFFQSALYFLPRDEYE